jgi:hypothetical protein
VKSSRKLIRGAGRILWEKMSDRRMAKPRKGKGNRKPAAPVSVPKAFGNSAPLPAAAQPAVFAATPVVVVPRAESVRGGFGCRFLILTTAILGRPQRGA